MSIRNRIARLERRAACPPLMKDDPMSRFSDEELARFIRDTAAILGPPEAAELDEMACAFGLTTAEVLAIFAKDNEAIDPTRNQE